MRALKLDENKELVEKSISKYGYAPEHNYWYFVNMQDKKLPAQFFDFGEDKGLVALRYKSGDVEIVSEMLAPEDEQAGLFMMFLDFVYKDLKTKKVFFNADDKLIMALKEKTAGRYKIHKPCRTFDCPIYDVKKWDADLGGKEWKKYRNMKNSFFKSNDAKVVPHDAVDKEKLLKLIDEWCALYTSRVKKEWAACFKNFVLNDFKGCDIARVILVDDQPCALTAGWKIPNTNSYYSAIGVHNYKYKYLGEIAYLDDFASIKQLGAEKADLGGSDSKELLAFKLKFRPERLYRTHFVSVSKIK